jgi:prophage tail gpP-like protein
MIKLVVDMRDSKRQKPKIAVTLFNEISINLKFDSVASTFKFKMYFDPSNVDHAELATVSHIHECSIYYVHDEPGRYINSKGQFINTTDELIITGFMLSQRFNSSAKPSFMEIGGYSKPGVLADCDIPTAAYPLESNGLTFRQIVNKILPYFGQPSRGGFSFKIKSTRADSVFVDNDAVDNTTGLADIKKQIAAMDSDADDPIEKSTAPESKNVLAYLKELAIQKNLTLSHDVLGNLIVNVPYIGNNYIAEFGTENGAPFIEMDINYNGQPLHSEIEVVRQPDKNGGNLAYWKIANPLVPIVYRPRVIVLTSGDDNTIKLAARSELGTELKNIPLIITLDKPTVNGRFMMPNNTIKVKNRECYLYEPSKWFIEEINYSKDSKDEKCVLTCVMPGVYAGEIKNPFIDPHKNIPRI